MFSGSALKCFDESGGSSVDGGDGGDGDGGQRSLSIKNCAYFPGIGDAVEASKACIGQCLHDVRTEWRIVRKTVNSSAISRQTRTFCPSVEAGLCRPSSPKVPI